MPNLRVNFAGLELRNPLVVASAGITETVERMKRYEEEGAAAVVMKSYFEEKICRKAPTPRFKIIRHGSGRFQTFAFYSYEQASEWDLKRYAREVEKAKAKLNIKIIPSINCVSKKGWLTAAKTLEKAGADAIELNTSCPHGSITFSGGAVEQNIVDTVRPVRDAVSLPLIAKISPMLTDPFALVKALEETGMDGVTIFNRQTGLDIDVEEEAPVMHRAYAGFGGPWAIHYPLRWISQIRPQTSLDIAGSGGVWNAEDVVKYLLAGADVVQVCTAIYLRGYGLIRKLLDGLAKFMTEKGYGSVDDFKGNAVPKILTTEQVDRRKRFAAEITPACNACGLCARLCTYDAIKRAGKRYTVVATRCVGCGFCVEICPNSAITLVSRRRRK